ncbi:hypothetical protein Pmani_035769, partial [Petrolisthes manimaculis]
MSDRYWSPSSRSALVHHCQTPPQRPAPRVSTWEAPGGGVAGRSGSWGGRRTIEQGRVMERDSGSTNMNDSGTQDEVVVTAVVEVSCGQTFVAEVVLGCHV